MRPRTITRRRFVTSSAAAAAAVSIPVSIPHDAVCQSAPHDTLRIGCIGVGRMGHGDMRECIAQGLDPSTNARVVAVCDLDSRRAQHAQQEAERHYARRLRDGRRRAIDVVDDFRQLLARDDIDGVTVSTPDHWHALVAIAAANAGKAVYLQKPLTYTIAEGQKLIEAVRRNNVILQTGSQQRSSAKFRRACELVRSGRIGALQAIRVLLPADHGFGRTEAMPEPEHLNYDMWLGPAPRQPYTVDRVHPQPGYGRPGWLQIEDHCRGMITGWGSHMFDIAQWAHGSDASGPVEFEAAAEFPDRGLFNVHTTFHGEARYADGVKLIASSGEPGGVRFEGDAGWISVDRSRLDAQPREVLTTPLGENEVTLVRSDNHMRNFLQSIRSQKDPICPVEVGHRSNSICVIFHIAMRLGRKLKWDPQSECFIDDVAANALLDYDHREPWTI